MSLFVDLDPRQISASRECGADVVEIHTGIYSNARTGREAEREFDRVLSAVETAGQKGLGIWT